MLISGCEAIPVISAAGSLAAAGLERSTAEVYKEVAESRKVEIDKVISKDCLLMKFRLLTCEQKALLNSTEEGIKLLKDLAKDNMVLVDKCPNIERLEPLPCP